MLFVSKSIRLHWHSMSICGTGMAWQMVIWPFYVPHLPIDIKKKTKRVYRRHIVMWMRLQISIHSSHRFSRTNAACSSYNIFFSQTTCCSGEPNALSRLVGMHTSMNNSIRQYNFPHEMAKLFVITGEQRSIRPCEFLDCSTDRLFIFMIFVFCVYLLSLIMFFLLPTSYRYA